MSDTGREEFELWYSVEAFDIVTNPIGSRDCGLQWKAWQARGELEAKKLEEANKRIADKKEWQEGYNQAMKEVSEKPTTEYKVYGIIYEDKLGQHFTLNQNDVWEGKDIKWWEFLFRAHLSSGANSPEYKPKGE